MEVIKFKLMAGNLYYLNKGVKRFIPMAKMIARKFKLNLYTELEDYILEKSDAFDFVYHVDFLDYEKWRKCEATIIGPNPLKALQWDSKVYQVEKLAPWISNTNYMVLKGYDDLLGNWKKIRKMWDKFVISAEFGDSGFESIVCNQKTNPIDVYQVINTKKKMKVTPWIDDAVPVSTHVVIGKNFIFVSPFTKQHIEHDVLFRGADYPFEVNTEAKMKAYKIGNVMREDGYLGLAHIDMLIRNDGRVYFMEVNPRKAGTSPMISYSMELDYNTSLPIMEFEVATTGKILSDVSKKANVSPKCRLRYSYPYNEVPTLSWPGQDYKLWDYGNGGKCSYYDPEKSSRLITMEVRDFD